MIGLDSLIHEIDAQEGEQTSAVYLSVPSFTQFVKESIPSQK